MKKYVISCAVSIGVMVPMFFLLSMSKDRSGTIISYFTVVATVVVGFLAAWVSMLQRETAEKQARNADEKLRLDLFDRRYEIVERIDDYFRVLDTPGSKTLSCIPIVKAARSKALLLFGEDVVAKLEELDSYTWELNRWESIFRRIDKSAHPDLEKREEAATEAEALRKVEIENWKHEFIELLQRYMRFEDRAPLRPTISPQSERT